MTKTKGHDPKAKTKSGHKSLRIKQKVQFAIEFWAQFDGKSDTAFIESACVAMANQLGKKHDVDWGNIFDDNEGIRKLRIFLLADYPLSDDETRIRSFVRKHWQFFYSGANDSPVVNVANAEILWPRIEKFAGMSEADYWAPGKAMVEALTDRGVTAPKWPPKGHG